MNKIGLFFGPIGGSTHRVGQLIAKALGAENVDLIPVKEASAETLSKYHNMIFGISTLGRETWDGLHTKNDWDLFMPILEEFDFTGKTAAIYGLGDSVTYAMSFVDHMGILGEKLLKANAKLVGSVDPEGYTFEESKAILDGKFYGLPIDEDFEDYLTQERVDHWVKMIKPAMIG
jgi:flavodoxin I